MRKSHILISFLLWAPLALPAHAESLPSVQMMLDSYHSPVSSAGWLFCGGILLGTMAPMLVTGQLITKGLDTSAYLRGVAICPGPESPTGGAMIQAFENWAAAHPEEWNNPANVGAMLALRATWPCK